MPRTIFEALVLSGPVESKGAALRARAARLNAQVVQGGRSLASLKIENRELSDRDQSLLRAILSESLRWHHRFEWQLSKLLDKPLKRRESELAALLRIGLTQLEVLRIPDHAAVSATVDATSKLGLARARGLVNAVLRRYLRDRDRLAEQAEASMVARFSHPEWLISALQRDWPSRFESILEANNSPPPLWLRVNRRRIDRDAYLTLLEKDGIVASVHSHCLDAVLLAEPRAVHRLPGFSDGLVSVQDVSAQQAVDLLDLSPGHRVLDACAAPGGKTAHMLERCSGLAEVVTLDRDPDRLKKVRENLDRLGLEASIVRGDAADPETWFSGERFDRILLDAPCSASGVIRRHPDIKLLRRPTDLDALTARQSEILDALWPLLSPGGLLVYATCSVFKVENQSLIETFADRKPDAILAPFGGARHYQLFPGDMGADGFYYACLSKGASDNKYKVSAVDP